MQTTMEFIKKTWTDLEVLERVGVVTVLLMAILLVVLMIVWPPLIVLIAGALAVIVLFSAFILGVVTLMDIFFG